MKVAVEIQRMPLGGFDVVITAEGLPPIRHGYDDEDEAREALRRGIEALSTITAIKGFDIQPAAESFLAGASLQRCMG